MSYVLDALRRAESERQRGSVPNLHAQNHAAPERRDAAPAPPAWRRAAPAGALILAGVAVGVWWWTSAPGPEPAPVVESRVNAPSAPVVLRPLPAPAPTPRTEVRPAPAQGLVAVPSAASAGPTVAASSAPGRVPRLQDLPEPFRRQIPALAFGGATDSPEPAARMLIINGQIWREGDEPAAGLKLERIALRGAVFRYREQRFEVSF